MCTLCDLVYVLLLDRVIAVTLADRQTVGLAAALGGQPVDDLPDPDEAQRRFDAALNAPPVTLDPFEVDWRAAVGLPAKVG